MPPASSKKTLSPAEVGRLKAWIEQGAEYREHWAFVPPVRPELPAVKNPAWCRNPIDFFVLARLEAEGLLAVARGRQGHPDPPAQPRPDRPAADDRGGRRVPRRQPARTPMRDWWTGSSTRPHYGERWGRIWLDAARYADSDGYEKDKSRQVFAYRDWVIHALNRDLPYDQFIIEQIAGDLLPGATQDQVVATGFLRNSMINEEGGVDPEQFRMEAMFDRMDCIGKGVLGLTIQCAQCHSHKYDPLTQDEYYRMFAFLNNSHEANVAVYSPDEQMKRAEILRKTREIEDDLKHREPDWRERMAEWEKQVARRPARVGRSLRPEVDDESTGGEKELPMEDGSFLVAGLRPDEAHARADGEDRRDADHGVPPRAAQRPQPAAGRPRPVDQGDGRADRVPGRGRPGRCAGEDERRQVLAGHGRRQPAREAARPDLRRQERQEARDRAGRVRHRRQGRHGLGHRRRAGPSQPAAQGGVHRREADRVPARHDPDLPPDAEPRRLEQRRQPEPQPRPVPALDHRQAGRRRRPAAAGGRAMSWPSLATSGRRPRRPPSSATGAPRSPVEGRQRPDRRPVGPAPGGRGATGPLGAVAAPADPRPPARRLPQAGPAGRAGRPVVPQPDAARLGADPAGRSPDGWSTAGRRPTARSIVNRVWQADFGTGIVAHQRGLRPPVRAAQPPRAARLAGRRVHGPRLEPQGAAPADRRPRRPIASRRG